MARLFWLIFAISGVIYAAMMFWTMPALIAAADGLMPFDMRPGGYDVAEARAYLAALSDAGRAVYLGPQHTLDLIYPATLATALVLGLRLVLPRRFAIPLAVIAILGAVLDYTENQLVARMLTEAAPRDALIERANLATQGKSIAATIAGVALVLGGLRAGWRRLRGTA